VIPPNPGYAQAARTGFDRQGAMSDPGTRLARVAMAVRAAGQQKPCATAPQAITPLDPFADAVADRAPA